MQLLLNVDFNSKDKKPLYRIYSDAIKQAILEQRLKPGDILPTVRSLAKQYSIGRSTVLRCYEDLLSQGVVETKLRIGTCVSQFGAQVDLDFTPQGIEAPTALSDFGETILTSDSREIAAPAQWFTVFSSDLQITDQVKRTFLRLAENWTTKTSTASSDTDAQGYRPLRVQMQDYLRRTRGINTSVGRIIACSATELELLLRLLIRPGDIIVLENPCDPQIKELCALNGATVQQISVDSFGLCVADLERLQSPVKLVYVTPSHQTPSGVTMSLQRRHELVKWARERGVIIIEDDTYSEFVYGALPQPSIHALDSSDSVIYISSAWKLLEPLIKLRFVVIPQRFNKAFKKAKRLISADIGVLEQMILSEILQDGRLERHLFRVKNTLCKRRQTLIFNLAQKFGRELSISKTQSGTHIHATFGGQLSSQLIVDIAGKSGLLLTRMNSENSHQPSQQFLISFSHCDNSELVHQVNVFGKLYQEAVVAQRKLTSSDVIERTTADSEHFASNNAAVETTF